MKCPPRRTYMEDRKKTLVGKTMVVYIYYYMIMMRWRTSVYMHMTSYSKQEQYVVTSCGKVCNLTSNIDRGTRAHTQGNSMPTAMRITGQLPRVAPHHVAPHLALPCLPGTLAGVARRGVTIFGGKTAFSASHVCSWYCHGITCTTWAVSLRCVGAHCTV